MTFQWFRVQCTFFACLLFLQGCASSSISDNASAQAHSVFAEGDSVLGSADGASPADSWADASQVAKGAMIGGVAGALAGGFTGVGWLSGAAGGAIFGGAMGAWVDAHVSAADELKNQGNSVMVLGDQVRIVLPTGHLFYDNSSELTSYSYATLDSVVRLVAHYPNRTITVAAYADPSLSDRVTKSLTQQQADHVMKYLWRAGINTRLLYATGYGGARPVAPAGETVPGDNDRIEITLEKLPV
ncbi:MAG: OmpA family protein [Gammaproteobacteria bacterium]|nr:OmpA family protein [Gammaproteobacteria bacterium]